MRTKPHRLPSSVNGFSDPLPKQWLDQVRENEQELTSEQRKEQEAALERTKEWLQSMQAEADELLADIPTNRKGVRHGR